MLYDSIYRMSGKEKLLRQKQISGCWGWGVESGVDCEGTEGVLGVLRLSIS